MEKAIKEIYEIIKDYREFDKEHKVSEEQIKLWIDQFDQPDRLFLLTELKQILQERYYSKKKIRSGLKKMMEDITKEQSYDTVESFLKDSQFIRQQPEGKSQHDFLEILFEISIKEFGVDIENGIVENPKYFIYLDDIFCTGDTLFKALVQKDSDNEIIGGWFFDKIGDQTHIEYLESTDAKLLVLNFINHEYNSTKFQWRLNFSLGGKDVRKLYTFYAYLWVKNNFEDKNAKLDFVFPQKVNQPQNVIDFCKELEIEDIGTFREELKPDKETFFSSAQNRTRFENIILQKSLFLYDQAGENRHYRMRPLGYGLGSHKNLGFGTLCFTYRNVPFNTPLVFWYTAHNTWVPLFKRFHSHY